MRDAPIDLLRLTPEQMRALGYRAVDEVVRHWATLSSKPAMRVSSREELGSKLQSELPRLGSDPEQVLQTVVSDVFGAIGHLNHPRFFGFIPSPSNFVSVAADILASGFTPFCGTWLEGSGAAQVELITLSWLKGLFGLPRTASGLFTSGGSLANLTALAGARQAASGTDLATHRFYCSDQTHSSVDRAVKILGYAPHQLTKIQTAPGFRIDIAGLRQQLTHDRERGLVPAALIANAGTTNTGALDPLEELAELCWQESMWLHVDAAYGGAAILTERGRAVLRGIERADSITLDPHKWMFQPFPLGCVLVRSDACLRDFFQVLPEYLRDAETERGEVNFCDYGPELTRPFRALKLWMSLKIFGADAFARAIDRGIDSAEELESMLREGDAWEIVSPASMGIVCFRYLRSGLNDAAIDELNTAMARDAALDGCCFLSTTVLRGRPVLRACTINPSTTDADLQSSIECLERMAATIAIG
jgi:glutamate/tyrosine decarboxylase-like PLP-dependent enzyme